jgi:hypothetical protein
MSPCYHAHQEGESCLIVCAPSSVRLRRVRHCPNCKRVRRFVGRAMVWYDTIWTCCACGDSYSVEGRMQRPFARGWRADEIRRARREWDAAPPSDEGKRILREMISEYTQPDVVRAG